MMSMEAVLLTGGQSRRMGQDKASLLIDGEAQADRIVRLLNLEGIGATVLGKTPIEGANFFPDDVTVHGPIDALFRFRPTADLVFVLSCDLPCFDARLAPLLSSLLGEALAVTPFVDGFRQPMVTIYRREAFMLIPADAGCPMDWLDVLNPVLVDEAALGELVHATRGANTPKEFAELRREQILG